MDIGQHPNISEELQEYNMDIDRHPNISED